MRSVVAAAQLLDVPVIATHSALYEPATSPEHVNIALSPDQAVKLQGLVSPLAYPSTQL